jgi:hypothetical protein
MVTELPDLTRNSTNESIFGKLETLNSPPLYLGVFYRPPNCNDESLLHLEKQLDLLTCKSKLPHLIIGGDFNVPSIDWENNSIRRTPQYGLRVNEKILEILEKHSLHQQVDQPTHGKNTLDLFLTTSPDLFGNCKTLPGMCNHEAVTTEYEIKANICEKKPREIYIFNRANTEQIINKLVELRDKFLNTWSDRSVEENWRYFKNSMLQIIKDNIPTMKLKEKTDVPWLTYGIKRLMKKRKRRYQKAKTTKMENDWKAYKTTQKQLRVQIKIAHDSYLENIFNLEDKQAINKKLWSYIKSLRREKVGINVLQDNGKIVSDGAGKAELLSQQFEKVFTTENNQSIPVLEHDKYPEMDPIIIEVNGVEKLLKQLNVNKALGPDEIPTKILKEHANILAPVITIIFQQSIECGISAEDWLKANVTALFKNKGSRTDAANYCPISL